VVTTLCTCCLFVSYVRSRGGKSRVCRDGRSKRRKIHPLYSVLSEISRREHSIVIISKRLNCTSVRPWKLHFIEKVILSNHVYGGVQALLLTNYKTRDRIFTFIRIPDDLRFPYLKRNVSFVCVITFFDFSRIYP